MLEISHLEKKYGTKTVLADVSVSFGEGVYGILGENGAGKTTMLRCIAGIIRNYQGTIRLPKDCHIGYLPQRFGMMEELTVWEALKYAALLKKIKASDDRMEQLLRLLNLEEQKDKRVAKLSGGMLRRLGIAQAFLDEESLVLLDEPTAGLDPVERIRFKEFLQEMGRKRTVLLSTHLLNDVEAVYQKVMILQGGRNIFEGTVEELKARAPEDEASVEEGFLWAIGER